MDSQNKEAQSPQEQRIIEIQQKAWKEFFEPSYQILNELKVPRFLQEYNTKNWNDIGTIYRLPNSYSDISFDEKQSQTNTDKPILVAQYGLARTKVLDRWGMYDLKKGRSPEHYEEGEYILLSIQKNDQNLTLSLNSIIKDFLYPYHPKNINEKYDIDINNIIPSHVPQHIDQVPSESTAPKGLLISQDDIKDFKKIIADFLIRDKSAREKVVDVDGTIEYRHLKGSPHYFIPRLY